MTLLQRTTTSAPSLHWIIVNKIRDGYEILYTRIIQNYFTKVRLKDWCKNMNLVKLHIKSFMNNMNIENRLRLLYLYQF